MDSQQVHTIFHSLLHNTYNSSNSSSSSSVHLTPAEKQTLLLTLQKVSKSMGTLIDSCCNRQIMLKISKFANANTPEAWLARHGHLLAELHVGKGVVQHQQLAAIVRGLQAANARPGCLQLQVFTGYPSFGLADVLAELQDSSQHLTRLELLPPHHYDEEEELVCVEALQDLMPQLQQLQTLNFAPHVDGSVWIRLGSDPDSIINERSISVAHLSHLTSLKLTRACVSSSEDLPGSLQHLQLAPVVSIKPLMQLTGLRSLHLNIGTITASCERQQLLEQLAAQCTKLESVSLLYSTTNAVIFCRQEMAAWALLPVRVLQLVDMDFDDDLAMQQFPQLLAATHNHLTELHFGCVYAEAVQMLPVGLAQLTGLQSLQLNVGGIESTSVRQQLLEQVAAQCTSLREVGLDYCDYYGDDVLLSERDEMAGWARLPVCSLHLVYSVIPDDADVQLFPDLLAATHKHLTKLFVVSEQKDVLERLPVGLAQLTGLRTLDLCCARLLAPSDVEQLFEVVGAQLVNLRDLSLSYTYGVSHAALQHLSAARSLTRVSLSQCKWEDGVDDELMSRFEEVNLEWGYS